MEHFAKIFNGFQLITILAKSSIINNWQGSQGYAFDDRKGDKIQWSNVSRKDNVKLTLV